MKNNRNTVILRTSFVGIVVNIILAAFKASVGIISSSIAVTLDAVNNLTDAVSSIITIVGTRYASKSPDKKHPFGYGRIEYLSTLAIALIIVYAGVTAGIESIKNIVHPKTPEYTSVLLIILGVAVLAKVFLGLYFTHKGKQVKSGSLIASGKDALSDVLISVATIVAAVVYLCFDIKLEAYLGVIISALIIKAGFEILSETISKILGERASVELVKEIKQTLTQYKNVKGAYDLIFNNYGEDRYLASVHIEVPETLTATEIDALTRHITEDVYQKHRVLLTAVGIYSENVSNVNIVAIRSKVSQIALSYKHVNQIHGFFVEETKKIIVFDMVISFDEKDRNALRDRVMAELKKEYADYEIRIGMDYDFNEI